jgi:hypothetical protein
MEIVQRILGKIVGEQVSAEELELVSGGLADRCASIGYSTYEENDGSSSLVFKCCDAL